MLEHFDHTIPKHLEAMKQLPFSYFSLPLYLDEHAFLLERNGEAIVAVQNQDNPSDVQALFVPSSPKNWSNIAIRFATKTQRDIIATHSHILFEQQTVTEFFYRTEDFVHPTGSLAKKIHIFEKRNDFSVIHVYSKQAIEKFYRTWHQQRIRETETEKESEDSFFHVLNHLDDWGIKQVYVEINGELAGLAWGVESPSKNWVGLHMKVQYSERSLSQFLHHERAKLFANHELFSLGTAVSKGVEQFKRELGPMEEREYSFLLLGNPLQ